MLMRKVSYENDAEAEFGAAIAFGVLEAEHTRVSTITEKTTAGEPRPPVT